MVKQRTPTEFLSLQTLIRVSTQSQTPRLLSIAPFVSLTLSLSHDQHQPYHPQHAALPSRPHAAQHLQLGGLQNRHPRALPRKPPSGAPRASRARRRAVRARRRPAQVGRGRPVVQGAHRAQHPARAPRARVQDSRGIPLQGPRRGVLMGARERLRGVFLGASVQEAQGGVLKVPASCCQ